MYVKFSFYVDRGLFVPVYVPLSVLSRSQRMKTGGGLVLYVDVSKKGNSLLRSLKNRTSIVRGCLDSYIYDRMKVIDVTWTSSRKC